MENEMEPDRRNCAECRPRRIRRRPFRIQTTRRKRLGTFARRCESEYARRICNGGTRNEGILQEMRAEASAAFQRNKDGLDQTKLNIKQRARVTRMVLSVEIKYIGRHQYCTVRYLAAHSATHRVSSARPQPERRAVGDVHTRPMHAYPAYGESRGAKRRAVATSLRLSVTA